MAKHADAERAAADLADMRAIASGDRGAFARLIDRESPRLLRFALGVLGSLEEAEDVVQETLLSLWENAAGWEPRAQVGTWLHTICYNRAVDRLRRRRNFVDASALDGLADNGELPGDRLAERETVRSIRDAVARLPERQRTAVLLFHFQDLSQRDAARVMGIGEHAFESLLSRARRLLRQWLSVAGGEHD